MDPRRQLDRASALDMTYFATALFELEPEWGPRTYPLRGGHVVLTGPDMFVNRAMAVAFDELLTSEDLSYLESQSSIVGVPSVVEVSELTHPEVVPLLLAHEYAPGGETACLLFDASVTVLPTVETTIDAVVVESAADLERWQHAMAVGWGHINTDRHAASNAFAAAAHATQQPGLILAIDGGEVVGCAALSIRDGVAIFGGMSTLPDQRRRGVQSAMIRGRLRLATEAGCAVIGTTAELGGASMRNLIRHGFSHTHTITSYTK